MKPNFALNLSHEGIALLHRSPRGTWTEVGEVALGDPELRENLSFLRSTAVGLEGKGFGSKLILPNSQVLYLEINAPGPGEAARMAQIVQELEGKTPYEVADLAIDWTGAGPIVQVAVVANVTLDEAEEFAVIHRFNPISFSSRASEDPDAWEPFFGRTDFSFTLFGADVDVRETPVVAPVTNADLNLFQGAEDGQPPPDMAESTDMAESVEDSASFFEAEPTKDGNIFAQAEKDRVEPDPKENAEITQQPDTEVADNPPVAPVAFSSRRHTDDYIDAEHADRPLDRVTPRFDITPDLSATAADLPEAPPSEAAPDTALSDPQGGFIAENQLRASLLGEDEAIKGAIKPALVNQVSLLFEAIAKRVKSGANSGATLGATAISALRGHAQNSSDTTSFDTNAAADNSRQTSRKKRLWLYSAGALFILGLLGLVYFYSASDRPNNTAGGNGAILSTTSAARGVRQNNRPQSRPSDFARTVAVQSEISGSNTALTPIRPKRRSAYEGGIDPEAGLPDTAKAATNLTAQELADIAAAGLAPPTQEEIAESGDGTDAGQIPRAELAALYAKSGILQGLARLPKQNPRQVRDDIFVAALDRDLKASDATILPDFNSGVQDYPPEKRLSPLPPDMVFKLDERGLVIATKAGTLNPDGILIRLGKPQITPPKKPTTGVFATPTPLASIKPRPRPTNLKTGEDAIYAQGTITLARLRTMKPTPRPISAQIEIAAGDTTVSELAVLTSFQPAKRPGDFGATVEKTRIQLALAIASANQKAKKKAKSKRISNVDVAPILPTRASVAKTATIKNAISLTKVSLIGVYGTPSKRAALLRLPSGRFVRVRVGDRVDGGRVAGIDVSSLSYVKKGRNRVLKVPKLTSK